MSDAVLSGAEPYSAAGGPHGALVLHGITGSPGSVIGLARALAATGMAVEAPLLPGHGTSVDDLLTTGWSDWSAAAEAAYLDLASRCERVVVAGLSMGGTLATWLASRHSSIAGLVCVNPMIEPVAPSFLDLLESLLEGGVTVVPGGSVDIARPDAVEAAYGVMPVAPTLTLLHAVNDLEADLGLVRCPVLIFTSTRDRVVPPSSSDHLAARVAGPVERVRLEQSYHVATLDFDAPEIEARAAAFARTVTEGREVVGGTT